MAKPDTRAAGGFFDAPRNLLFVVVAACAAVCLCAGIAAAVPILEAGQRWILIVLCVAFAVAGLLAAVWTVWRTEGQAAGASANEFGCQTSPTENQRRRLNENLREIIQALKLSDVQIDDLFSAYIVAEDLALRQIEQESRENLLRHQTVGGADFDAVLLKSNQVTCIETAFLVAPDVPQSRINEILTRVAAAKKSFERTGKSAKLRLLLVLITQLDKTGEAQLRSSLVKKFSATAVDVDIRLFDFEELQRIYAP